jgi:hypothetical protein
VNIPNAMHNPPHPGEFILEVYLQPLASIFHGVPVLGRGGVGAVVSG